MCACSGAISASHRVRSQGDRVAPGIVCRRFVMRCHLCRQSTVRGSAKNRAARRERAGAQ